jgi:AcrR family transcriptional regulator
VEAAVALFDAQGVEETSVDEITARAAVAKGTFYVHFQRKQDVLLEQAAGFVLAIRSDLADLDAAAGAPDALRKLVALTGVVLQQRSRALVGRSIREMIGNREQWLRVLGDRPTLREVVEPLVARGQAEGAIRDDLSAARVAHGLTVLLLDAVIGWSERAEDRDLVDDLQAVTSLWLDGARPR